MKKLYPVFLALLALSCGKESMDSKLVEVKYVINSNTDRPFFLIIYDEADASGNSKQKSDWMVLGKGRFEKVVKIQDGYGAGLIVEHAESGDWNITLYQGSERLDSIIADRRAPGELYKAQIGKTINRK